VVRHLRQHAILAQEIGASDNVAVVKMAGARVREWLHEPGRAHPRGYVFVDGSRVGDIGPSVVREREALARDGIVVISLILDKKTGRLHEEPEILTRGFIYQRDADDLLTIARRRITETVSRGNGNLQVILNRAYAFFYNETKRRPSVFVTIRRIGFDYIEPVILTIQRLRSA
jgi:ribonuclease J